MANTATFHPAPGILAPKMRAERFGSHGSAWADLREDIVEHFGCSEDAISIEDFSWFDGECFADFVTIDGRIVGSLDDKISSDEWRAVLTTHTLPRAA